jgi:hypothetical protein
MNSRQIEIHHWSTKTSVKIDNLGHIMWCYLTVDHANSRETVATIVESAGQNGNKM